MVRYLLRRCRRTALPRFAIALCALVALVLTSLAPAFAAGGESGNLNGTVHDSSGKAISGATVAVASPSGTYKQSTDAQGFFQFLGLPVDTYTISIEAKGYESLGQPGVNVTGGITTALGVVKLAPLGGLRTIGRVTARSPASAFQPNITIPQFTVSGQTLLATQGKAASSDESAVLLSVPGFELDKGMNLVLEGSLTDQIHYQFDGVDFTDPGFTRSANSAFFNGVSSVQIVPGAGDPSQGNAGSGVVNLIAKRGTYPASGLVDFETLSQPFLHQLNLQYGIASPNGRVSDYLSFFGVNQGFQYGPFASPTAQTGSPVNGTSSVLNPSYLQSQDFINNFVYKFGKNNSQTLQAVYLNDYFTVYSDIGGVPLYFGNDAPDALGIDQYTASNFGSLPNLTNSQIQSILGKDPGQGTQLNQLVNNLPQNQSNNTLLKFEYDNSFNATTYLQTRYFVSHVFSGVGFSAPSQFGPGSFAPLVDQTAGGSRTGANFELTKQADSHNLLTLSGSFEFNRPNFGTVAPDLGFRALGPDVDAFLKPANPNAPVSATNPCPVATSVNPTACYLQQYFYTKGGTPDVPPLDLNSYEVQDQYGMGLRDQIQVNSKLRFDFGARYDLFANGFGSNLYGQDEDTRPVPGSPGTYFINNFPFVNEPHFLEPRAAMNFRITPFDSVSASYGESINLPGGGEVASPRSNAEVAQFASIPVCPTVATASACGGLVTPWVPFTLSNPVAGPGSCYPTIPFPAGANSSTPPSYKGSVGGANPTLQLGKPCSSYAQLLLDAGDLYYPEITAIQPAVFQNFDFSYSHGFRNGSGLKVEPFYRRGYDVQLTTAPLIYNPATGTSAPGSLSSEPYGKDYTTGLNLEYTLPERPVGLSGFVTASYINEFVNTPAAGANFGQDFEPFLNPAAFATNNLYRAGFVSPFTGRIGLSYKTKSGFRINPVISVNTGYPYNEGLTTPQFYSFGTGGSLTGVNVPNTNLTEQYSSEFAPQYVDPANPGPVFKPNLAASRGTAESLGSLLSRPQIDGDMTIEYSPPRSRTTFGLQVLDLFNNQYYSVPSINPYYEPVTSGVAGPLTGQDGTAVAYPGSTALVQKYSYPYGAYNVNATGVPTNFRLYVQYAL
jgi:Carboxypeptidase regulatory-like domain/TonB dependent receptor